MSQPTAPHTGTTGQTAGRKISLGVNIDHVATLRNARGERYPDPIQAALLAEEHGADGITAHLREDRRHIKDGDLFLLKSAIQTRLNLEMANTDEMVAIAQRVHPFMVTLVPERREELTTEGGLNVKAFEKDLKQSIHTLKTKGIQVSLFIDADPEQVEAAQRVDADMIEFHTGRYCHAYTAHGLDSTEVVRELLALHQEAEHCQALGMVVNAGHGLNRENVTPVLTMPGLWELNIGHSIIADALFMGLGPAVSKLKAMLVVPEVSAIPS